MPTDENAAATVLNNESAVFQHFGTRHGVCAVLADEAANMPALV